MSVAGAEPEFADEVGRDVDVVGAGEVVRLVRSQEAEAVGHDLDRAHSHDRRPVFRLDLEDGEEQVLLAQRRRGLDAERFGCGDELRGGLFLEVSEVHGESSSGEVEAPRIG